MSTSPWQVETMRPAAAIVDGILAALSPSNQSPSSGLACRRSTLDVSNWTLFAARVAGSRVGGAAVAFNTPGLTMLEGRRDHSLLWDIRVTPDARGKGIGSALFERVEAWAQAQGCRQLEVETQNVNVRACGFYARHGCELRAVRHAAYPELPEEIQLLWYKDLRVVK